MSNGYTKWSDVKGTGHKADPRTAEEQAAGKAYVAALGGSIDVVARLGDRSWKVA
jgi:hypothetical protein